MLLGGRDIEMAIRRGRDLRVDPFYPECIQPASLDVHLGRQYRVPNPILSIDVANVPVDHTTLVEVQTGGSIVLGPGDFILGCTEEIVQLGTRLAANVEGRSSLGRLGLTVHITAGLIDPGFAGQITLEIVNNAPWDIVLWPGMRIAQLAFVEVSHGADGYSGAYQNQLGPVESKFTLQSP